MLRAARTHDHAMLARIAVPVAVTFVFFVGIIFLVILPFVEARLMDQKRLQLKCLVDTVYTELAHHAAQVEAGNMPLEEAQQRAIDHVRALRYGPEEKDYFWINDMHPNMIMHPYRSDLDGKDITGFTDPKGKHLFVEFVKVVEASGAGYVDYMWQWKDDAERIVPKLSYVRGFEPWGWVLGTGIYVEDVREELAGSRRVLGGLSLAILVVVGALCAFLIWETWGLNESRRQAEREMRESEARYRTLFEEASDGILLMKDGLIVDCNPGAERMLGVQREQLTGGSPDHFAPKDEPAPLPWPKDGSGGASRAFEWRFVPDGGGERAAEVGLSELSLGDETYQLAVIRDITERKHQERERKKLESQLRQAQKMEAVGTLAGGVAHDFNNMLSVILGYGEILREDLAGDAQHQANLNEMLTAARRSRDITRQLLAFSRKQVFQVRTIDLDKVIRGMERMMHRLLGEDVRVVVDSRPGTALVEADLAQLEQVLLNLCINARDAMPAGGTLALETGVVHQATSNTAPWTELPAGHYAFFRVRDTGAGMTEHTMRHAFDPFFTTKDVGEGTGLGLSTVHGIIKQHGGEVGLESAPDRGTAVTAYLPLAEKSEEAARTGADAGESLRGNGETILVVEDESAVLRLVCRMLKRLGYEPLGALGHEECLSLAQGASHVDLLITDVVMPQMTGAEVHEMVARVCPGIRVLFISGYTDEVIAQHGMLEPGVNLLPKPFDEPTLSRKVHDILHG